LILGFISKEDARCKLGDAPLGTFLLRFSETNIVDVDDKNSSFNGHGYLTIAVNEQDPYSGQSHSHTHTHTHTRLTALFQDYPGEPVPER